MTVNVFQELSFLSLQADQDSVCKGEPVTIYGQVEGGNGGPYEVSFDDQIVSFPYEFYPQNSGWHYLRLKDACETPAARDSIYIHVWSAPQNNFISNKVAGCPTLNIQFTEINIDPEKPISGNLEMADLLMGSKLIICMKTPAGMMSA